MSRPIQKRRPEARDTLPKICHRNSRKSRTDGAAYLRNECALGRGGHQKMKVNHRGRHRLSFSGKATVISRATIIGLVALGTPLGNITQVEVEIYEFVG